MAECINAGIRSYVFRISVADNYIFGFEFYTLEEYLNWFETIIYTYPNFSLIEIKMNFDGIFLSELPRKAKKRYIWF